MKYRSSLTLTLTSFSIVFLGVGCTTDYENNSADTTGVVESDQTNHDSGTTYETDGPRALQLTSTAPPSNLLVISVDTIRADYVYGEAGDVELPFIQELMAEGLVLIDHQSCSNWTIPSFYCMVTGRSTSEIGYHPTAREHNALPLEEYTLAERMVDAGFSTSFVTSNPLMTTPSGISQGFEEHILLPAADATEITNRALETMESLDQSGWFSQIHYFDPHSEYNPPEQYLVGVEELEPTGVDLRDIYDISKLRGMEEVLSPSERAALMAQMRVYYAGELRYLDAELRRFFTRLEADGRLDNTLVLFIGDHGEQHLEHGKTQHGRDLFQEETRVPAFFWMKNGGIEAGQWQEVTTHTDILPTILEAMSVPYVSPDITLTGAAVGNASPNRTLTTFHAVERGSAVRVRRASHELIYRFDGEIEVYRLSQEHTESADLYTPGHPYIDELLESAEEAVDRLLDIATISGPTQ